MSLIGDLRIMIYLRRIARAEERQAAVMEELAAIERERWRREAHIPSGKIIKTEIGTFDIAAANESYRKEQEAAEFGATLEDIERSQRMNE